MRAEGAQRPSAREMLMDARLSSETVTPARADEPQHPVTIAALKDLQRRAAPEHCVGRQQKVERGPWSRSCEAVHDVGNSWKNFSLMEAYHVRSAQQLSERSDVG